ETYTIKIGKFVPLTADQKTYVIPHDSYQVYVVGVNFDSQLTRPLNDFRDKVVLDLPADNITKVRLEGTRKIELTKSEDQWSITSPVIALADNNAVNKLLSKFAKLRVTEFLDDKPRSLAAYGLEPSGERLVARIWVRTEQPTTAAATAPVATAPAATANETHVLALGLKTQTHRYAKLGDSQSVFLVPSYLIDDLQPELKQLRETKVLPINGENVLTVDLDLPAGKAELRKVDGTWKMTRPYAGPANGETVNNLLEQLGKLEAHSFRDEVDALSTFGLDPVRGKITIHQAGKQGVLTLLIGSKSPSDEMTFVKTPTSDTVTVVKTEDLEDILANPSGYWHPAMWAVNESQIPNRLTIRRPDETVSLELRDGEWYGVTPWAGPADGNTSIPKRRSSPRLPVRSKNPSRQRKRVNLRPRSLRRIQTGDSWPISPQST
ncbi:MAG: DUF4340 domain-containing protein, partial [Planctomycetota bacterium]